MVIWNSYYHYFYTLTVQYATLYFFIILPESKSFGRWNFLAGFHLSTTHISLCRYFGAGVLTCDTEDKSWCMQREAYVCVNESKYLYYSYALKPARNALYYLTCCARGESCYRRKIRFDIASEFTRTVSFYRKYH